MPTVPEVRERKTDDAVAQRLRSVLAGSEGDRPAPAAAPSGARPAGTRQGVTPLGASPAPPAPLAELATVGEPLSWADIVPAWPDDVDLEQPPTAVFRPPVSSVAAGSPPESVPAAGVFFPADLRTSHLGDVMPGTEPVRAPVPPPRSLPPPAWVLPEADDPPELPADPEPAPLTAAGAFGGDGGRFGIRAFDPGRRGVKALAAVAVVVIVVAALLAWRSRPRLDPVAPPAFDATGSAPADGPAAARRGASSPAEVVVAVGGKVRKPGLVRLAPGARVADALTAAGGADPGVDVALLNPARKVVDGELILVGVTPAPGAAVATGPAAPPGAGPAAAGGLVNLNTATLADLDGLPGVGPVLAQRILDARDAQGGFGAVGDLRKVDGIGDARYEQLKDLVTV